MRENRAFTIERSAVARSGSGAVFDRLLHSRYLRAPWQERLVMSWSGMRGAVSLAAASPCP